MLSSYNVYQLSLETVSPSYCSVEENIKHVTSVSYHTPNMDLVSIQSLNNESRKQYEEIILGKQNGYFVTNDLSTKAYRNLTDLVDLRILNLSSLEGKNTDTNSSLSKVLKYLNDTLTLDFYNNELIKMRKQYNTFLPNDPGFNNIELGGVGLGTLLSLSPINKEAYHLKPKEELEKFLNTGKYLQLPVSKKFKENEKAIRETDSAKFIFFTSEVYGITDVNDCHTQDGFTYYSDRGNEINGCQYWYKDVDNVPSIIRPLNLSTIITMGTIQSTNPSLTPVFTGLGSELAYNTDNLLYTNSKQRVRDSSNNDGFWSRYNHHSDLLQNSLLNKIIVVEHKRINTTIALNDKGVLEITCPIARSIIDQGYRISSEDRFTFTNALSTFSKYILEDFIPKLTPSTDKVKTLLNTRYKIGIGKTIDSDKYVPNNEWLPCLYQNGVINNSYSPVVFDSISAETGYYNQVQALIKPRYSVATLAYIYRENEVDEVECDSYYINKYEVPTIWLPDGISKNAFSMGVEVNVSLSFVKNTIIDTTSSDFLSEDVVYDRTSNLVIGKVYKDHKETMKLINENPHPMSLQHTSTDVSGYSYLYVRESGSYLPKKIYISNFGVVEEVRSILGDEEGLHVFKDGEKVKIIKYQNFPFYGIFNTKKEAEEFNIYGDYYKESIKNLHRDLDMENKIKSLNIINLKHDQDMQRTILKGDLIESERRLKEKENEGKRLALHAVKLKTELEIIKANLEKANIDLENEGLGLKSLKSCIDAASIISKGIDILTK